MVLLGERRKQARIILVDDIFKKGESSAGCQRLHLPPNKALHQSLSGYEALLARITELLSMQTQQISISSTVLR
jgi:hypothetical protein